MTKIEPIEVTCPSCGSQGIYQNHASANVTLDPDLKERVMDGSLFVYECPNCGDNLNVVTSCLYHDMTKQLLLQLDPDAEDDSQLRSVLDTITESGVNLGFTDAGYEVRLVSSLNDLREKILIADDDLDDRIVEIIKIYAGVFASEEEESPEFDDVRYMGLENDGIAIGLFSDGSYQGSAMIPMTMYKDLSHKYPFDSRTGDDFIVDYGWAYEAMGLRKEG